MLPRGPLTQRLLGRNTEFLWRAEFGCFLTQFGHKKRKNLKTTGGRIWHAG